MRKALEKDRDQRYETASACAADIQRYLTDEPVLACLLENSDAAALIPRPYLGSPAGESSASLRDAVALRRGPPTPRGPPPKPPASLRDAVGLRRGATRYFR